MVTVEDYETKETLQKPWYGMIWSTVSNLRHLSNDCYVEVKKSVTYQTMMGFGGAVTGAVAYNLDLIPMELEDKLLESYFSRSSGIGYSMLRMAIGGSDFDLAPWVYNESPANDKKLSNFTKLDPRDVRVVERVKKAKALFDETDGRKLKIKAAAWVCPKWMRTPNRFGGPGEVKREYYQTWANYHIRFLELMEEQGIDIWALSTGNEPLNGLVGWIVTKWMTLGWHPTQVAEYVALYFGPTIKGSRFNKTLILAGDDQRSIFPWYFQEMQRAYPKAFDYIDGLAVHSYLNAYLPAQMLSFASNVFPDQFILNTESSIGDIRYNPRGPLLGSWSRAVEYIHEFMGSFKNSVVGWIDWNILLDEKGGPNYVGNVVETPIVVNATGQEAYKQPIFHAIAHFSKFIHEGSVRVEVGSSWDKVHTIGFRRPDNAIVVLISNRHDDNIEVMLADEHRGKKVLRLPPDSLTTVLYRSGAR